MDRTSAPTQPSAVRSAALSPAAIAMLAGGLLGWAGVLLKWFKVSVSFGGGTFLGQNVPGLNRSATISGTHDWTGVIALIAGVAVMALGLAVAFLPERGTKKTAAMAAAVGGVVVLLMAVIAFVRVNSVVGIPAGLGGFMRDLTIDAGAAIGLYVSALGGVLGAVGGFLGTKDA